MQLGRHNIFLASFRHLNHAEHLIVSDLSEILIRTHEAHWKCECAVEFELLRSENALQQQPSWRKVRFWNWISDRWSLFKELICVDGANMPASQLWVFFAITRVMRSIGPCFWSFWWDTQYSSLTILTHMFEQSCLIHAKTDMLY